MSDQELSSPLWLAHHREGQLHRCVRVGRTLVCARCLAVYPVLFAAVAAQLALRAPLRHPADAWLAFLLPLPAVVDYFRARLNPSTGTNLSRLLTGAGLGLALGRTLYTHLKSPFNPLVVEQLAGLVVVVVAAEVAARVLKAKGGRPDPTISPDVQSRREKPERPGP